SSPIPPAVNQVEFHPFLYQRELLEYCQGRRIQLEAYSPLTRGRRLRHPVIKEIAAKYRKTPAQVLIRWGLQHGIVEIPKSVRPTTDGLRCRRRVDVPSRRRPHLRLDPRKALGNLPPAISASEECAPHHRRRRGGARPPTVSPSLPSRGRLLRPERVRTSG